MWLYLFTVKMACAEVSHTIFLYPGSSSETNAVIAESGATVGDQVRRAGAGGGWTYSLAIPPEARCVMTFDAAGKPEVTTVDANGQRLPNEHDEGEVIHTVRLLVPATHPLGSSVRFEFRALAAPIAIRKVQLAVRLPDGNHDELSDAVESMMGVKPGQRAVITTRPSRPHTSFFYAWPYDPVVAVPPDAVRLYFWSANSDPAMYGTWAEKNYAAQTMIHSRFGQEVRKHMDEVQTKWDGARFSVGGPTTSVGIEADPDYYMVPTKERTTLAQLYYSGPLGAGATGIGFDEPEYHVQAGYSDSFKKEWQMRYGTPWQPPHSSVDARYQSEKLKAFLLRRQVKDILSDAQRRKPSATRLVAWHSPVNYPHWGFVSMHYDLLQIPALQEIIAEVWTGTARTPVLSAGVRAERTFEVGYIEYSSCYHLARGTGKRMWFLMDPMEDNLNRPMEDYQRNYAQTLLAALMFPRVDSYEVLVWPNRIFGHVPKEYATLINTVVGALCEMWRYPEGQVHAGSEGMGTFVADSIGWQRAEPSASNYDGFFALCLPFVLRGVPVQVLSLDRAAEPGYLEGFKTLLVSYDFLKPLSPALNPALADWTRRGGSLVFIGGTDAYNTLTDSWWRKAGYATPGEDLFAQMGLPLRHGKACANPGKESILESITNALPSDLSRLRIPGVYPITIYTPPPEATPLYRLDGESAPPVWEAAVGKGTAFFVGVAPGYFSATEESSRWLRALGRRAFEKSRGTYREQPYFLVRRGPYVGIRTLEKDYAAQGRFVDLLSPTLAVVDNPTVTAQGWAFWSELGPVKETPRVVAASGRLCARNEQELTTAFLVQAPARTEGAARLWAGKKPVAEAKAFTIFGAPVPITVRQESNTVLLQYTNDPDGIIARVEWEKH